MVEKWKQSGDGNKRKECREGTEGMSGRSKYAPVEWMECRSMEVGGEVEESGHNIRSGRRVAIVLR